MLEIFLTLFCLSLLFNLVCWSLYFVKTGRVFDELGKKHGKELDIIYRYLSKIHNKEDLDHLLENKKLSERQYLIDSLNHLRRDIVTQMGDLSTKHDFIKLQDSLEMNLDSIIELRSKLKEDRYKNMRVAFGGKEEEK